MNFFQFIDLFNNPSELVYLAYPCFVIDDEIEPDGYYYPATVEMLREPNGELSLGWYRGKVFFDEDYDVLGPTFEEYFGNSKD